MTRRRPSVAPAVAARSRDARRDLAPRSAARRVALQAGGLPTVRLDRLELPTDVPNGAHFKTHLRKRLKREARRATWGAGRDNVIQYRFKVTELDMVADGDVLRVRCTAVGKLPGGQAAKSHLTFGGDPGKRRQVVEHVLDIVARGVITRLSELERIRRGDLDRARVRAPSSSARQ